MKKSAVMKPLEPHAAPAVGESIPLGARLGRIVTLDENVAPVVDFDGNPHGPLVARLALASSDALRLAGEWQRAQVLIVFLNQDMRQPVITGVISDSFREACAPVLDIPARLEFEAGEEVVLQCGDAKIVLRRDGKVAIGGREIESRAQQKHRIRGGTVSIN